MDGTFEVICAMCGADLTVAQGHWDNKSVLRPLVAIEVMPCTNCMSRVASEAKEGESHE